MITVVSRPSQYNPVYLPVLYKFTSDKMPNSVSGESASSTLRGENIGDDLQVDLGAPIALVVGDYVLLENAGSYEGVTRVKSILAGTSGVNVTKFTCEKVVVNNPTGINLQSSFGGVTTSKYYNNFSIVIDLYVSGNLIVRLRKKRDENDEFIFDISRILQEYVGSDLLSLSETDYASATDFKKEFYIQYAEEYDEIDANAKATITLQDFTDDSSNTKNAVNTVVPYVWMDDFTINSTNYDLSDFITTTTPSTTTRFVNDAPLSLTIGSDESYQLTYIQGTIAVKDDLKRRVITYDSSGAVIATTDTTLVSNSSSDAIHVACGTTNLGATITAATVKYEVLMVYGSDIISETVTFNIDTTCYKVSRRFEWLNKQGGIDAFTCIGEDSFDIDIDKTTFKRVLDYPRTLPERNTTVSGVTTKRVHTINTGLISKEERDWLVSLLESPEVYLVVSSQRLPVNISDTFGIEKIAHDTYNITFEYEIAVDVITQRN